MPSPLHLLCRGVSAHYFNTQKSCFGTITDKAVKESERLVKAFMSFRVLCSSCQLYTAQAATLSSFAPVSVVSSVPGLSPERRPCPPTRCGPEQKQQAFESERQRGPGTVAVSAPLGTHTSPATAAPRLFVAAMTKISPAAVASPSPATRPASLMTKNKTSNI